MENIVKFDRIKYFDTTKGILMLLLIYGHLIIFARSLKVDNNISGFIQNTVPFYRVFFMQTFFFITGYCTTWNINFPKFIKKSLKTIVLPAFFFLPFDFFAKSLISEDLSFTSFTNLIVSYIINGLPWFLASLFIAKVLFYWIFKCIGGDKIWIITSSVIILILGVYVSDAVELKNIWSFKQALLMIPFMGLGYITKMGGGKVLNNKSLLIVSIPYFCIIIIWQLLGLGLGFPAVDYYIDVVPLTVPFHIVFAISGSALILLISKLLQNSQLLNLIGKNSLFVYLTHAAVVCLIISLIKTYFQSLLNSFLFFPIVYFVTVLIMIVGCKLVETKYFCWMIGKF